MIIFIILMSLCQLVKCFNLNPIPYNTFKSPLTEKQYFGYSITFRHGTAGLEFFVGAPKSNSSYHNFGIQTGVVYHCVLKSSSPCREMMLPFQPGQLNYSMTGAGLEATERGIIVCSPMWRVYKDNPIPNGGCHRFQFTNTQDVELEKVIRRHAEGLALKQRYLYEMNQFGFSLNFDMKTKTTIFGCPGRRNFEGGVAEMVNGDDTLTFLPYNESKAFDYAGYFVKLYGKENDILWWLSGNPRGNNHRGEISYLSYEGTGPRFSPPDEEIGQYFGAAIEVSNFDMKNGNDIAISAPYHSRKKLPNVGIVFVHYHAKPKVQELFGDLVSHSFFGQALSLLDLTSSGRKDLVIGAPFENNGKGAIYIFSASCKGLSEHYTQKLSGENLPGKPRGFGFSFSKEFLKDNQYGIVVGAPLSNEAFVFIAQPILTLRGQMKHISSIPYKATSVILTACFQWFHNRLQAKQNLKIMQKLAIRTSGLKVPSAVFKESMATLQFRKQNIRANDSWCSNSNILINEETYCPFLPIHIEVTYEVPSAMERNFVVVKEYQKETMIEFDLAQNKTISNYRPKWSINLSSKNPQLIDGTEKIQKLVISNTGFDGFQPQLEISTIPTTGIRVSMLSCKSSLRKESSLICDLPSPFYHSQKATFNIFIDTRWLNVYNRYISLVFNSISAGQHEQYQEELMVPVEFTRNASLILDSWTHRNLVVIDTNALTIKVPYEKIEHFYSIQKIGPTPSSNTELIITFLIENNTNIIEGIGEDLKNSAVNYNCTHRNVSSLPESVLLQLQDYQKKEAQSLYLKYIQCELQPFTKHTDFAQLKATIHISIKRLGSLPYSETIVATRIFASFPGVDKTNYIGNSDATSYSHTVVSTLIELKAPMKRTFIPKWVHTASSICGISLVIIIAAVLYKLNFFKRPTREELLMLKLEAEQCVVDNEDIYEVVE